jgi:hypothetical protein
MPRVKGFLRIMRHRDRLGGPVDPDYGVEAPVDPDYGVDEGAGIDNELPEPPPGIWPPLTPGNPIRPVPPMAPGRPGLPGRPTKPVQPDEGHPDQELPAPPGSIWPRPPGPVSGYFIALVRIPGMGWRYIVIDPDGWEFPENGHPGQDLPGRPTKPGTEPHR